MQTELKKLGLSQNEIEVYLTLLSIGRSSLSVLSYRTGLNRNACRYVCNQLIDKKLILSLKEGNLFLYEAESPEKLYYLIEQEEQMVVKKREGLDRVMSELKILEDPDSLLPRVIYSEGTKNVIDSYRTFFDLLPENSTVYDYVDTFEDNNYKAEREEIIAACVEMRRRKNIKIKCISTYSKPALSLKESDEECNRETLFIPRDNNETFEWMVCEDIIFEAFFYPPKYISRITKNEKIAKMHLRMFKLAWERAKFEDINVMKQCNI